MGCYSKQWCDLSNSETPSDFDIEIVANDMRSHSYKSKSCEGIGFDKIYKDQFGRIWLGFQKNNGDYLWQPYQNVVSIIKKQFNENSSFQ